MLSWSIEIWDLVRDYHITKNSELEKDLIAIINWDDSSMFDINEMLAEIEDNYKKAERYEKEAEAYRKLSKTLDELTWELKTDVTIKQKHKSPKMLPN